MLTLSGLVSVIRLLPRWPGCGKSPFQLFAPCYHRICLDVPRRAHGAPRRGGGGSGQPTEQISTKLGECMRHEPRGHLWHLWLTCGLPVAQIRQTGSGPLFHVACGPDDRGQTRGQSYFTMWDFASAPVTLTPQAKPTNHRL